MTGVPAARGSAEGVTSDWCCDLDTISCCRYALHTKRKHEALVRAYRGPLAPLKKAPVEPLLFHLERVGGVDRSSKSG